MGRTEKNRGRNFEYWMAERLQKFGWEAKRNPLSGSSVQISQEMGKNDVRAFFKMDANDDKPCIKMFVECKKTSKKMLSLKREWFEKLGTATGECLAENPLVIEPLMFAYQPDAGKELKPIICLTLEDFEFLLQMLITAKRRLKTYDRIR